MRNLLLLWLIFLSSTVESQNLKIKSPLRFLALGDSYTIGEGVPAQESWPQQLADSVGELGVVTEELKIIARTGWRTDNLLNAIDVENPQPNYNLVSLLIGVNNQFQGVDFEIYPQEFRTLLETAIAFAGGDTSNVFVLSIPDYGFTPFGLSDQDFISAEIDKYNDVNREIAREMGVAYFYITAISREVINKPEYLAPDNLHPSGEMYAEWIKLILNSSNVEVITSNDVHYEKKSTLTVYPNPAVKTLQFRQVEPVFSIAVFNNLGQKVLQKEITEKEFSIDISSWSNGLYHYQIIAKNGTKSTGSFVKH